MSQSNTFVNVVEELTTLLNAQLQAQGIETQYTSDQLTFGTPTLYDAGTIDLDTPQARNTSLEVEVPAEVAEGAEESPEPLKYLLHYNRLSLSHLFSLKTNQVADFEEEFTSTVDALEFLSTYYQVPFGEADVEDELVEEVEGGFKVIVKAAEESLTFFGSAEFTFLAPIVDPPVEGGGEEETPPAP